jgi:hypothetical protein
VVPGSSPGRFDVDVVTGAGRSGSTVLVDMSEVRFRRLGGSEQISAFPVKRIGLDGYTHDLLTASVGSSPKTQEFDRFSFRIDKLIYQGFGEFNGPMTRHVPIQARASLSRITSVRLCLDESMIYESNGAMTFDETAFNWVNVDPFDGVLPTFYSDLIRINISALSQRPPLSAGGNATQLYLSGDLIGLSTGTGSSLEVLFKVGRNLDIVSWRAGSFSGSGSSGNYELVEMNPLDPLQNLRRLQSTWTEIGNVVQNMKGFEMMTFPSADPTKPDQLLMLSRNNNGGATACYIGDVDLQAGTFFAYPVHQVDSFAKDFVGGNVVQSGDGGTFTFTFGTKPASFPSSGTFLRFIR